MADFVSDVIDRKPIDNFCLCGTPIYSARRIELNFRRQRSQLDFTLHPLGRDVGLWHEPKGYEISSVGGLTYNLTNADTNYRNGVDFHVDWAASKFLTPQVPVGVVGYFYQQLTADSGAAPILGDFKSRVADIGPQRGYLFPVGKMQGYLNFKGYWEFDAKNRPEGWR